MKLLTKKQADKLAAAMDELDDAANVMDPLIELTTGGESEDREGETQFVQDALTDWLVTVAAVVRVAREVGLKAEVKEIQG
jgi:hypothetical protein